jgi:hypothetical protein
MLVVEHHNIGRELVHMKLQVCLMHFHKVVVVVDLVVDNLFVVVVVETAQVDHVEVVVLDYLLLHMDQDDNLHKHHNHYKKNIFILLKKILNINRDGGF